jgi:putative hydrolase of the HAD superfamily
MGFEVRSQVDHREFSMVEVATPFLTNLLGRSPGSDEVDRFIGIYIQEWNGGVYHIDGMAEWITELSQRYRLVIVSNTHEADLVPGHLRRMGIADLFDLVVLSVQVGWRKPHPEIYTAAMDRLRLKPENAVFVGDNYLADYVGPSQAGIRAYVIDPLGIADIPDDRRLRSVFEVAERILG